MHSARRVPGPDVVYRLWRARHLPQGADLYRQRLAALALPYQPLISVITPLHDTPPDLLDRMLRSVSRQTYPFWEHCLVDDGSSSSWLAARLSRLAREEPRIRFASRRENGGIVAASNDALRLARGTFVVMLDHDDELDPRALFAVASRLNADPETDIFYSDFDVIDRRGRHGSLMLLPDWSPDVLLMLPLLAHLTAFRRSIVEQVGGWRPEFEGSQDYDLALRTTSLTDRVVHIPEVLYHWRQWERSVASNPAAKPYAYTAAKVALEEHLRRQGIAARREDGEWIGWHSIRYDILGTPLVSIVATAPVSAGEARIASFVKAVRQLTDRAGYDRHELVLVVPSAATTAITGALERAGLSARLVADESGDAGVAANAGAAAARGDHLVFIPLPVVPTVDGWLSALLEHSQREPIGAAGSRLTTREGIPWHAGVILPRGVPHLLPVGGPILNCSAVSGVGMMTRRSTFERAGGFRPAVEVGHPDLDYCLRLRQLGFRHLAAPHAQLQFCDPVASALEPDPRFVDAWRETMHRDPYYNPNYCQETGDLRLSLA